MTYEQTLEAYRALLQANPGKALWIGCDCAAVLVAADRLYGCSVSASGFPNLSTLFPLSPDGWDDEDDSWMCDVAGLETADAINNPRFLSLPVGADK
ncbi:hypothetical protein [Pseudomonas aeruginosa]|uniref:hypothetical protein n=1 Tax=Pseudomonas aeruginosa TaxID=287 RepID=UPI000D6E26C7|nr:hypothetical protein [Pseudomonas aeruginosa]